jgi:hypothetical protein
MTELVQIRFDASPNKERFQEQIRLRRRANRRALILEALDIRTFVFARLKTSAKKNWGLREEHLLYPPCDTSRRAKPVCGWISTTDIGRAANMLKFGPRSISLLLYLYFSLQSPEVRIDSIDKFVYTQHNISSMLLHPSLIPFLELIYPITKPNRTRDRPLEIIAVGLSRSGTDSLCTALKLLGYNECHHASVFIVEEPGQVPQCVD